MSLLNAANSLKTLTSQLPLAHRLLAGMMGVNEGSNGLAITKAIQDTVMVWAPKALISRSEAERTEVTVLEFVESFLVYFALAGSARHVFYPLASKLSGVPKMLLTQPLNTGLQDHLLRRVASAKGAVLLASLGTAAIGGEYILNFAKTLMTEKVFKMSRFSDVASLSSTNNQPKKTESLSPAGQKAVKRIGQCLAITAGVLAAAAGLARYGGNLSKLPTLLGKVLPKIDFSFAAGKPNLSSPMLLGYMGIAFASYLDSCRDNLERIEVGTRLGIVLSFLFGGQELIQKAAVRIFGKMVPDVLRPDRSVKPLTEIANLAMQRGGGNLAKAAKSFLPMLLAKEALFFIPMGICIILPGIILGKLNQIWTAKRFGDNKAKQNALGYRLPAQFGTKIISTPSLSSHSVSPRPIVTNTTYNSPTYGFTGRPLVQRRGEFI